MDHGFEKKKCEYINELFGQQDDLHASIEEHLKIDNKGGINISPNEGRLLQLLISLGGVKSVVEIGTLYGSSSLWMAEALPEDGHIYTFEVQEANALMAQKFFNQSPFKQKITLIEGLALDNLQKISHKAPFDMVFIDANKGNYIDYFNWAYEHVKKGGLIVGDNTFLFGYVFGHGDKDMHVRPGPIKSMQEFNLKMSNVTSLYSSLIPSEGGMTIAVKK